ncbi:recombinase family protein [Pannus brasiliensis CCIBt3594]|uniref:Recombinase family protein n=1 Tax=Pannus brasiliensis CCIBt3594 TaxID=1427578 RepID=A0AAW9QN08_9CHRO
MSNVPIWIEGTTRAGKTTRLVEEFRRWVPRRRDPNDPLYPTDLPPAVLVLAANDDNKRELADRSALAVRGGYPVLCKTPLGFITDEVLLFWPLIFEALNLKARFPLRLRPETEQELATDLWRERIRESFDLTGIGEYRFVRQTLDLLQLAGASGIEAEEIPKRLETGFSPSERKPILAIDEEEKPVLLGELILQWRDWCLERGLLSYGIIYELYWRYLLPDSRYREQLLRRYQAVFADDVDDYPAIARDLLEFFLDNDRFGVFTYNPHGQIRLGLTADPDYLQGLAGRCSRVDLAEPSGLAAKEGETIVELIQEGTYFANLSDAFISLQTMSRAELLRKVGRTIIGAIERKEIDPEDIVVIAPGLDEIARYSLMEILTGAGIPVQPINEQRPLIGYPLIRALLTLLALVYPGNGRFAQADAVAEMLVIFSARGDGKTVPDIDPARAGLLADHCYQVDPDYPRLLAIETFPRWDRLGHKATLAYETIRDWIEKTRKRREEAEIPPAVVLDAAIEQLLHRGEHLPHDRLAALRELMETVQHFWEVDRRLRQCEPRLQSSLDTVTRFIQLLRRGTITANPYPVRTLTRSIGAVSLGNIFQYRSLRGCHRWHFWLDCSSPLWEKGGAATLFGAPFFSREWDGETWTAETELESDRSRLERVLRDLSGRATERIFLCHSDLGVTGTEQIGPLLSLVQGAREWSL